MIPQLSVRDREGNELTGLTLDVSTNPSSVGIFRIYNNYEGLEGVLDATNVRIGLTVYRHTGQTESLIKSYESKIMRGKVQIKCNVSSKKGTVPEDNDWHTIEMIGNMSDGTYRGYFENEEFDVIKGTGEVNYNDYSIQLIDLPEGESGKTYEIFLKIDYDWKLD